MLIRHHPALPIEALTKQNNLFLVMFTTYTYLTQDQLLQREQWRLRIRTRNNQELEALAHLCYLAFNHRYKYLVWHSSLLHEHTTFVYITLYSDVWLVWVILGTSAIAQGFITSPRTEVITQRFTGFPNKTEAALYCRSAEFLLVLVVWVGWFVLLWFYWFVCFFLFSFLQCNRETAFDRRMYWKM